MLKEHIIEVETEDGVRPIKFYSVQALEYLLGLAKVTINKYMKDGRLPKTPYCQRVNYPHVGTLIRLFTETQLKELREIYELYYPVVYKGRDELRKKQYNKELNIYKEHIKVLEKRWVNEDYVSKEPSSVNWNKVNNNRMLRKEKLARQR